MLRPLIIVQPGKFVNLSLLLPFFQPQQPLSGGKFDLLALAFEQQGYPYQDQTSPVDSKLLVNLPLKPLSALIFQLAVEKSYYPPEVLLRVILKSTDVFRPGYQPAFRHTGSAGLHQPVKFRYRDYFVLLGMN